MSSARKIQTQPLLEETTYLFPENTSLNGKTVGQVFLDSALASPHETFIRTENGTCLSYAETVSAVSGFVQELRAQGVQKGDKIVCYADEPLPTIYFVLACAFLGCAPVPVSPLFSTQYLLEVCKRVETRFIFTFGIGLDNLNAEGFSIFTIGASDRTDIKVLKFETTNDLSTSAKFLREETQTLVAKDIFMIQPTSGSTGQPKLVIRSHAAVIANAKYMGPQILAGCEVPRVKYLMLLTFAHSMAYHHLMTSISIGAELVVPAKVDTDVKLEVLKKLQPHFLPMPPRVLRSLYKQMVREPDSTESSLNPEAKIVYLSGGTSDQKILEDLGKSGIKLMTGYGSSESAVVTVSPVNQFRPGTAGLILPGVDLKLSASQEVLIKAPSMMDGYFKDDTANRRAFDEDHYYKTGDIGAFDQHGNLIIRGRVKDMFGTPEGTAIHPQRIESALEVFENIEQALLVGDGMPYLSALLVLREPASKTGIGPDGLLDPDLNSDLYEEIGRQICQMNKSFERIESVVRFLLYAKKFPEQGYRLVSGKKVFRDRPYLQKQYQPAIDYLYNDEERNFSYVPGIDRRLRKYRV